MSLKVRAGVGEGGGGGGGGGRGGGVGLEKGGRAGALWLGSLTHGVHGNEEAVWGCDGPTPLTPTRSTSTPALHGTRQALRAWVNRTERDIERLEADGNLETIRARADEVRQGRGARTRGRSRGRFAAVRFQYKHF